MAAEPKGLATITVRFQPGDFDIAQEISALDGRPADNRRGVKLHRACDGDEGGAFPLSNSRALSRAG